MSDFKAKIHQIRPDPSVEAYSVPSLLSLFNEPTSKGGGEGERGNDREEGPVKNVKPMTRNVV